MQFTEQPTELISTYSPTDESTIQSTESSTEVISAYSSTDVSTTDASTIQSTEPPTNPSTIMGAFSGDLPKTTNG